MCALAAGIVADAIIPDPHFLPHPIRAIGRLIGMLDKLLNRSKKRASAVLLGAVTFITVIAAVGAVSFAVVAGSYALNIYFGAVVEALLTFYILAAGSLRFESMKVYNELTGGDINGARYALSMIVGRDTDELDEGAIARAGVETVAENTSDGVIAPLLYTAAFGPVGGFIYKAVNTMDSMLGYRNERYEYFGKVSARADDAFNLIPSRISAVLMIVSSYVMSLFSQEYNGNRAFLIWIRDRYAHKSPNSAQTESVCAGALSIRLGGASKYGGITVDKPFIGDDIRQVSAQDIKRAIRLMYVTEILCTAVIYTITALILTSR